MKVKARGVLIVEFNGLKSKICFFMEEDNKGDKGINRI